MKQLLPFFADGVRVPDTINACVLAANIAKRHTVPAGAKYVLAASNAGIHIRWHASLDASIPAGDVTDGSGCEYNPGIRQLAGLTSFSIISPVAATVSLSFWSD